jgi:hypothetical protein
VSLVAWPRSWKFDRPRAGLGAVLLLIAPFAGALSAGVRAIDLEYLAFATGWYGVVFHWWGCSGGVLGRIRGASAIVDGI